MEDSAGSVMRRSSEIRTTRNLKELIFVDQKAFTQNFDIQNNGTSQPDKKSYQTTGQRPDTRQRPSESNSRKYNTCAGNDRASQASRSGMRRKKSPFAVRRSFDKVIVAQPSTGPQIEDYIAINADEISKESIGQTRTPWAGKNASPLMALNSNDGMHRTSNDNINECRLSRQGSVKVQMTRARDEHRKNIDEINKINDSVKYSARRSFKEINRSETSIEGLLAMA